VKSYTHPLTLTEKKLLRTLQCCLVCDAVVSLAGFDRCQRSAASSRPRVDGPLPAAAHELGRGGPDLSDPAQREQVPAGLVGADRQLADVGRRVEPDAVAERRRPARKKVLERLNGRSVRDQEHPVSVLISRA